MANIQRALRNTIGDAVARSASTHGDAGALALDDRTWTFSQIHSGSNRLAHRLIAPGLEKGDRVGACGKNSDACLLLWIACAKAGDDSAPELDLDDTGVVQILYTSGTTSDPKGSMHTHRSLLTHYGACRHHLDVRASDRSLAALPLYHSAQMHAFTMPTLPGRGYTRITNTPPLA